MSVKIGSYYNNNKIDEIGLCVAAQALDIDDREIVLRLEYRSGQTECLFEKDVMEVEMLDK